MTTSKKTRAKKVAAKRPAKKTASKKSASQTTASKKKSASKKAPKTKGTLREDTTLIRKKIWERGGVRTELLELMGGKATSFGALCKTAKTKLDYDERKTKNLVAWLRREGYVESREA